jgi:hypothetical protein
MSRIKYKNINLGDDKLWTIHQANIIMQAYEKQGLDLSLRQLYYQFVSKALLPNTLRSYKNLGNAIADGRLAGMIDWSHMSDRTRNVQEVSHWSNPADIIQTSADQFRIDKWGKQPNRIVVMVEKDALSGVIEPICRQLDVPFIACKGYMSLSEMHEIAHDRLVPWEQGGQQTYILHLGDHDPSGIDMSRDIQDRMATFESQVQLRRLALNMDQITQYSPPPNPAKLTDSRATDYVRKFGDESWELDALEPTVISDLIQAEVELLRDEKQWALAIAEEKRMRKELEKVSNKWAFVQKYLKTLK